MVHAEVALVEKMMSYGWFRDIYNAASSFYATIMGTILMNWTHGWMATESLLLRNCGRLPMESGWI